MSDATELPPLPELGEDRLPELPADQADREQHVEELLNADTPPIEALADYRQELDAWAVRHGLTLDEALAKLEADPNPVGAAWAAKIRADPISMEAMRVSIADGIAQAHPEAEVED
jgi:hypothetical protein